MKYSGQLYIVVCTYCNITCPFLDPTRICPHCCLYDIMTKMLLPPDQPLSKNDLQPFYDGNLLSILIITM